MERLFKISGRSGRLAVLAALFLIPMTPSAPAQTSRITAETAQQIQVRAAQLLASPAFNGIQPAIRDPIIESYVLNSFALAAGIANLDESQLTAEERDQAQRVIGAVLGGTAGTAAFRAPRPRPVVPTHAPYVHPAPAPPRYVYAAPPPPIVVLPPPAPIYYYLSPAPVQVVPVRHHKWGW